MDEDRTSCPVAPEDIRRGDYIAILQLVCEYVPLFGLGPDDGDLPRRMLVLPKEGGIPMRVIEQCLPFVLVEKAGGSHTTLDTRRHRLARLSEECARLALKRIRSDKKRKASSDGSSPDDPV